MTATPTPPVRRHTPLAVSKPDLRTVARVTDGWTGKKPITFDAAI